MTKNSNKSKSGTINGMRDSFKKATTEMLVLSLLNKRPMYVYEIVLRLDELSEGLLHLTTLYPALYRLVRLGYAEEFSHCISEDNRLRKYYSITKEGKNHLYNIQEEYTILTQAVDSIFTCVNCSGTQKRKGDYK